MPRSFLAASLLLFTLASCKRESPASAKVPGADSSMSSTSSAPPDVGPLPSVEVRGWSIFQEPVDANETRVAVWAPGDHQKEAFQAFVPDLYRDHYHFAEWSDGTLFAIRRLGDPNGDAWNDALWEYHDGAESRRVFAGKGLDFRISPDGKRMVVMAADSATGVERVSILDRKGSVLFRRIVDSLGFETSSSLWMGDSILYLDGDGNLVRWDLKTDSVTTLECPEGAGTDRDLLPDRDLLVASDAPVELADDERTGPNAWVSVLRRFDLLTGRVAEINRGIGAEFNPVFVGRDSVEYDDPTKPGSKRIRAAVP